MIVFINLDAYYYIPLRNRFLVFPQRMDCLKSEYFDFYANAEYPLIMRQQTIDDKVLKDLFGVNGRDFQELKEAVAALQKGELIIKNQTALQMGFGKRWKKILVNRLV